MTNLRAYVIVLVSLFVLIHGQGIQEYDEVIEEAQNVYRTSKTKPEQLLNAVREAVVNGFEQKNLKVNVQPYQAQKSMLSSTLGAEDSPELCVNHTNFAMNALMAGQEWALRSKIYFFLLIFQN